MVKVLTSLREHRFMLIFVVLCLTFQTVHLLGNDLRITSGLCLTPGERNCYGIDTRGSLSNHLYQKLGQNVNELTRYNWSPLKVDTISKEDCYNGGKFSGFQWSNPSEPLSVVLLLDIQGTIAGIQFWMPYQESLSSGQNYKYSEQPMIQNATTFTGIEYFYITVYFMKPEWVCTKGRSAMQLKYEGTISELFVQNGPSPKDIVQIPMNKNSVLTNHWIENNCVNGMGYHSFYDRNSLERCTSFQPIAIFFDHQGELNGFLFFVQGRATTASLEASGSLVTEWVAGKENSSATNSQYNLEVSKSIQLSSLHVFLTERPYEFNCDEDPQVNSELPICIVGAGISGMEVASHLEKKGYVVEIFEQESRVGGKMHTFRKDDELQVETCPLLLGPKNAKLNKYIDDFKLTRVWVNEKDRQGYALQNMVPLDLPRPDSTEVKKAILKYKELIKQYDSELQPGYLNATNELYDPILLWMKNHQLEKVLGDLFAFMITVEGYGALEDIPALYILQFIDATTIANLLTENKDAFFFIKEGLDKFAEKMASSLKSKIFLNHRVTRISRKKGYKIIYFGKSGNRKCSKVILAFPPLLPSVQSIVELSKEEEEVLDQVKIHRYTSAVHQIPPWNRTAYNQYFDQAENGGLLAPQVPQGNGDPVGFFRQNNKKLDHIYSSYSWIRGEFNSMATEEDLKLINEKLNASLAKISEYSKTFYQENTEYFPHVNTKSLKEGFYKKFDSIQGKQELYYATTLLTFEVMAKAIEMAEYFANKYF